MRRARKFDAFVGGHSTIADPLASEEAFTRFYHRDLPELDIRALWAEQTIVEYELARRIAYRLRRRVVHVEPDGALIDDLGWLIDRARRLRAEKQRRRHAT